MGWGKAQFGGGMGLLSQGGPDPMPGRWDGRGEARRAARDVPVGNTGFNPASRTIPAYQGYNVPAVEAMIRQFTNVGGPQQMQYVNQILNPQLQALQPGGWAYNNPNRVGSYQEQVAQAQQQQYANLAPQFAAQMARAQAIPGMAERLNTAFGNAGWLGSKTGVEAPLITNPSVR